MVFRILACLLLLVLVFPHQVLAAPYFYMTANENANVDKIHTFDIMLVTDGSTLTAMQTIINFNNSFLEKSSISILNSRCSFWAPANPALGYGNSPTPYFHPTSNSNKAVLACGFSNPGYTSADGDGDLVARVRLKPIQVGSTSLSFDAANTQFNYIADSITPGAMASFDLTIFEATSSPPPGGGGGPPGSPTPTPSPGDPDDPDDPDDPENGQEQEEQVEPEILTADDLTFVEIGMGQQPGTGGDPVEPVSLEVVQQDDSIPAPPADLEPRPRPTPFIFGLFGNGDDGDGPSQNIGDVLAAQSLRELLIPGQSQADQTVVLINLISTLTFLVLLAIVIWRLITLTRMNKLKSRHMKELLSSELAVLQSKLGNGTGNNSDELKKEIDETLKKLNSQA